MLRGAGDRAFIGGADINEMKGLDQAVRRQKRLLNEWTDMTPTRAIQDSIAQFGLAFLTGEPQHYMTRFTERQGARRK